MTTASKNESKVDNKDENNHGKQGFASMPKEKVQEIASKGGKSHGHSSDDDSNSGSGTNEKSRFHPLLLRI
ncbi:MAG: hypothetical protein H0U27_06440 [Nitrosopumilus sp.]|nr:hypothetical protein [Nitrosopumilus sp.]